MTVVRWADLVAVSEDIGQDQDGDWHFYGYLLLDRAGNSVEIGKRLLTGQRPNSFLTFPAAIACLSSSGRSASRRSARMCCRLRGLVDE